MKLNNILWLIAICIGAWSCSSSNVETELDPANINPDEAAIPDGIGYPTTELSEEDKQLLASAKGISAKDMSTDSLAAMLKRHKTPVQLCYFWSLKNQHYKSTLTNLHKISSTISAEKLNVVLVNMDDAKQVSDVNMAVRESGVAADLLRLEDAASFAGILDKQWKGTGDAFFIFNKEDGTGVFYDQELSFDELYVLLQPFTI